MFRIHHGVSGGLSLQEIFIFGSSKTAENASEMATRGSSSFKREVVDTNELPNYGKFEVIYQTRERVFHHISKHREES